MPRCWILVVLWWASPALAHDPCENARRPPHRELDDPGDVSPPATRTPTVGAREVAPLGDQALLYLAGVFSAVAVGVAQSWTYTGISHLAAPDWDYGFAGRYGALPLGIVGMPVAVAIAAPLFVWSWGGRSGRGGTGQALGWAVLGAVLGGLPGAGIALLGVAAGDDPVIAIGSVTAGVGWIGGAIVGHAFGAHFEAEGAPVDVVVGAGSVRVRGSF